MCVWLWGIDDTIGGTGTCGGGGGDGDGDGDGDIYVLL